MRARLVCVNLANSGHALPVPRVVAALRSFCSCCRSYGRSQRLRLAVGMNAFLVKPATLASLWQAIETALQGGPEAPLPKT
ncbi:hypothetical protein [Cupriavidus sp. HMR-1]|uniref:hypothetical protein n=1 Tax=Cupriavidus sp. HMR-1 TaxID=1249621 RepID=UPI0012676891|nr:hypothetical protein [Cupriavidus sp. HMR-1]